MRRFIAAFAGVVTLLCAANAADTGIVAHIDKSSQRMAMSGYGATDHNWARLLLAKRRLPATMARAHVVLAQAPLVTYSIILTGDYAIHRSYEISRLGRRLRMAASVQRRQSIRPGLAAWPASLGQCEPRRDSMSRPFHPSISFRRCGELAVRRNSFTSGTKKTALALLACALWTARAEAACPPRTTVADYVLGGGLCLAVHTFGAETAGHSPTLVVVVHGDISDGGPATYHVEFARSLARPGVVGVALIRPGYVDATRRRSEGSSHDRLDNYTPANIAAIAEAIAALKKHYRARRVIYVGHSGGAAIGGVIIGKRRLVDAAILVSCPCDVARWRAQHGWDAWRRSESPSHYVRRVPATIEVVALTGTSDERTPPALAKDYVRALARRGLRARFLSVDGAGHGFSGVLAATAEAVNAIIGR